MDGSIPHVSVCTRLLSFDLSLDLSLTHLLRAHLHYSYLVAARLFDYCLYIIMFILNIVNCSLFVFLR